MSAVIGLIAGEGRLPIIYAQTLRAAGHRTAAVGFVEETDPALEQLVDAMAWVHIGQVNKPVRFFRDQGVDEVVMAGKIPKTHLFRKIRPDLTAVRILASLGDRRDDTILTAVADHLLAQGFPVVETQLHVPQLVMPPGIMAGNLDKTAKADLCFGWRTAIEIGRLDIGQTVVVRHRAVLAVEAIEGTDEAIRRGASLGRGEAVVVKVAKPLQDMRFDVPTVGLRTVRTMIESGARVLGVEAGRSLFLDRDEALTEAERGGLTIVGLNPALIAKWEA